MKKTNQKKLDSNNSWKQKNPEKVKEQRSRYKKNYPEKVKEHRQRYADKKIREAIKNNPCVLSKMEKKLINAFYKLTRILYDDKLQRICYVCGGSDDLHMHHKVYKYPIELKDLVRLCRRCHIEEHQKAPPPNLEGERSISCGN